LSVFYFFFLFLFFFFFRLTLENPTPHSLAVSCDKKSLTLVISEHLQDAGPREVAEELPEASPRLILHRLKIGPDGEAQVDRPFFIIYNPLSCSVDLKRLFASAKAELLSQYSDLKVGRLLLSIS